METDNNKLIPAERALSAVEAKELAPTTSPLDEVETSLSDYVSDMFKIHIKETDFDEDLKDELRNRLGEMTNQEIMALYNIERTSSNDKLAKLLQPLSGVITSRQQAEIAQSHDKTAVQINNITTRDASVAENAPADVIAGLNALSQLFGAVKTQKPDSKED